MADAAAQRIRAVEPDGTVRTLAGPDTPIEGKLFIAGGYADGSGRAARFNWPMGMTIGTDGDVYVADSENHCIRRITPAGAVSTFSGKPGVPGHADGPRESATFMLPTGIATDEKGDLYVADHYAIRKISRFGYVSTITGLGHQPWAVAVRDRPQGPVIFAADLMGITARFYIGQNFADRRFASPQAGTLSSTLGLLGDRLNGNAFALLALDDDTVVYTDPRTDSVRLLETISGETKVLAGSTTMDGAADDAAFADGVGTAARFDAPAGLAREPDGRIVVADAGNRRLRMLSAFVRPFDPWKSIDDSLVAANAAGGGKPAYRIAFVGNSQVYSDTDWSDSIEGVLQTRLQSDFPSAGPIRVLPALAPGVDVTALAQFANEYSDANLFDAMIFQLNTGSIPPAAGRSAAARTAALAAALRALADRLRAAHIPLLVVTEPVSVQFAPAEEFWSYTVSGNAPWREHDEEYAMLVDAARRSGVPLLDLTAAYETAEAQPTHRALFGSTEAHFSAYGRAVTGNAIAAFVAGDGRWLVEGAAGVKPALPRSETAPAASPPSSAKEQPHPPAPAESRHGAPARSVSAQESSRAERARYESAWKSLVDALWMLTHTDAVHADDPNYKRATQSIYEAIGALDDGIIDSKRRAEAPAGVESGGERLQAALSFLGDAERALAPKTRNRNFERPRARALLHTRAAAAATKTLLAKCGCATP
ncbi:MAG TPA: hypothetical protein VFB22_02590 [Candidatus Baltobacteraceae bacterium]|nr:hypothetical protein [Candidatus Baltobacteraceae bacterium]